MISETLNTLALHMKRASQAHDEVKGFVEHLDEQILEDFEKVKVIDSFIFRFIKIQDLMGNKLFREVLDALGEYQSSMSMLDVLDKLEKLELLDSAEQWMSYRNLRNVLTHEYPDNRQELIEGIQYAMQEFHAIQTILHNIENYLQDKDLIQRSST